MSQDLPIHKDKMFLKNALEVSIRIGLLLILVIWCLEILKPFIVPIVWGVIIAGAVYPGYSRLAAGLGGRHTLAATLWALLLLAFLIGPAILLGGTLVESTQVVERQLREGTWQIPPPPESVGTWPVIGEAVEEFWSLAAENLGDALKTIAPQLKVLGAGLLKAAGGFGFGILQFIIAIIIAALLLVTSERGGSAARQIATRLMGDEGQKYLDLATGTVRSVTRGILGVALIQALCAGIGFLVVGIPGSGLLALVCLFLAVVQIGVWPVVIPAVIYVFSTADTVTAVVFLVWCVVVTLLDNVLKPILLGQCSPVSMVVIFLGAIGGFIAHGIIGLFVGAVLLAIGYTLFHTWLSGKAEPAASESEASVTGNSAPTGPGQ